ncbi:MAG: hypothetical protein CMN30_09010 [Sandaracinus sp.]|nr:hypothetical protein [Sandaracinus sp.]|tara:strand:+ start:255 stop:842 length:588 start_codon:yes stop_codon:yes gene_type:complete
MTDPRIDELLDFWLGPLDAEGFSDAAHQQRWFQKSDDFDRELEERFGALHRAAAAGELDEWRKTPRGRLALIVLLDQLSRNLHRDTPGMFAQDPEALALAKEALALGDEATLAPQERYFLYMPFMHSEDPSDQEKCVALFEAAQARYPGNFDPKWAVAHRDIVVRFGRFPHRNAILGRESTAEERAFLEEPGSSF